MSPIDWAMRPLAHYADFEGRASRSEYWWFQLFQLIAYLVLGVTFAIIGSAVGGTGGGFLTVFILIGLLMLALVIPNLAVMARRFHDQDLSGWLILLYFIPYGGGLIIVVFMCIRGTDGPNRYGSDPFGDERHLERVFA
jgi:uncharacterized membrane protein YhaH (DUF805 family)